MQLRFFRWIFAEGFTIKVVPSSEPAKFPLRGKGNTLDKIIHRMFSRQEDQKKFRERLRFVYDQNLEEILNRDRNSETRVHAELLLIDYFDKNDCNCIDG